MIFSYLAIKICTSRIKKPENYKNPNYQTPSYVNNKLGFWLVGYDGGVKLFSKEISILKNIFSTIDSMPMRKNEMSSKTSKCN